MHLVLYTDHFLKLAPLLSWPLLIGAAYGFIRAAVDALRFAGAIRDEAVKEPGDSVPPAWREQRRKISAM